MKSNWKVLYKRTSWINSGDTQNDRDRQSLEKPMKNILGQIHGELLSSITEKSSEERLEDFLEKSLVGFKASLFFLRICKLHKESKFPSYLDESSVEFLAEHLRGSEE